MLLRVGRVVERTEAEGPGARFAAWVQGCTIRCAGCCNPHLFEADGGDVIEVDALLARLECVRGDVEGVTLLGGEPFEQAAPLGAFAEGARAMGLSVMTFTGCQLEELRARVDPGVSTLLAATDLLVDGPYDARRPERERRWAGSSNQRFHFLTDRYAPGLELVAAGEPERTVELRLAADGTALVNGWPALHRLG